MKSAPISIMHDTALSKKLSGELLCKNVRIHDRRTSVRLESEMWEALYEVAGLQQCTVGDLCTVVQEMKAPEASFTGALRVFLMGYFRNLAVTNKPASLIVKNLSNSPDVPLKKRLR